MSVNYAKGDATAPGGSGAKIIAHVCNDSGYFAKGFVSALAAKYPQAQAEYLVAFPKGHWQMDKLGTVQFVTINPDIVIANMIAQRGIKPCEDYTPRGCPPIRYPALFKCLKVVADFARSKKAEVVGPRFGAGLSGGDWDVIEALIEKAMPDIKVTIYDLPVAAPAIVSQVATATSAQVASSAGDAFGVQ